MAVKLRYIGNRDAIVLGDAPHLGEIAQGLVFELEDEPGASVQLWERLIEQSSNFELVTSSDRPRRESTKGTPVAANDEPGPSPETLDDAPGN